MATHNFNVQIPTYLFLKHLDRLERQLITEIRDKTDFNDYLAARGKLKLIEELKNLPETLTIIEEHDNAVTKD